jgi:hypothetical protein
VAAVRASTSKYVERCDHAVEERCKSPLAKTKSRSFRRCRFGVDAAVRRLLSNRLRGSVPAYAERERERQREPCDAWFGKPAASSVRCSAVSAVWASTTVTVWCGVLSRRGRGRGGGERRTAHAAARGGGGGLRVQCGHTDGRSCRLGATPAPSSYPLPTRWLCPGTVGVKVSLSLRLGLGFDAMLRCVVGDGFASV